MKKTNIFIIFIILISVTACTQRDSFEREHFLRIVELPQISVKFRPDAIADETYVFIDYSELLSTGEILTAQEMESLKEQASCWRSTTAAVGSAYNIVAVKMEDESEQRIYLGVNIGWNAEKEQFEHDMYERLQLQMPDGVTAWIMYAISGAGSGEVSLVYVFAYENAEWIEAFYNLGLFSLDDGEYRVEWENMGREPWITHWVGELSLHEQPFCLADCH